MTAIAIQRKREILERICQGEILREIASDLGVTKQSLHRVLKDDPDYEAAKHEQAASMIDQAKQETWAAREPADIARAREITKFAFRYAESVDPHRWGQKHEVTTINIDLGDRLRRARERVIEQEQEQEHVALPEALRRD